MWFILMILLAMSEFILPINAFNEFDYHSISAYGIIASAILTFIHPKAGLYSSILFHFLFFFYISELSYRMIILAEIIPSKYFVFGAFLCLGFLSTLTINIGLIKKWRFIYKYSFIFIFKKKYEFGTYKDSDILDE